MRTSPAVTVLSVWNAPQNDQDGDTGLLLRDHPCRLVPFAGKLGSPRQRGSLCRTMALSTASSVVPPGMLTFAHQGGKAYCEGFDLVHWREAARSNGIWQVDHAPLSILLILEDGQTARPWLTIVIDDYSRAIAGYYLGFDPLCSGVRALSP
jgi:hypothetical protein